LIERAFVVVVALSVGDAAAILLRVDAFAAFAGVGRAGLTVVAGIIGCASANGLEDAGVFLVA